APAVHAAVLAQAARVALRGRDVDPAAEQAHLDGCGLILAVRIDEVRIAERALRDAAPAKQRAVGDRARRVEADRDPRCADEAGGLRLELDVEPRVAELAARAIAPAPDAGRSRDRAGVAQPGVEIGPVVDG